MIGVPRILGTSLPHEPAPGWAGPARGRGPGAAGTREVTVDGGRRPAAGTVALTVHGPAGALDLVVPPEASVDDVAREYAARAGLQFAPALHSKRGEVLDPRSP